MPITGLNLGNKQKGDLILSADWNNVVLGVEDLEANKLNLSGGNMTGTLTVSPRLGVGTAPATTLHIAGGNWDLANSQGDFKIGNNDYQLKIGVATGGGGAGDVYLRAIGGTNRLMIRSGTSNSLVISGANVGVGTTTPRTRLHILGGSDVSLAQDSGSFLIGDADNAHLALDTNEIMAKTNGTTAGTLYLQNNGGALIVAAETARFNSNVGIGINPVTGLHINRGTDVSLSANSGFLILGNAAGAHIAFDNNEIMAKANGTTIGVLSLQIEGGQIATRGYLSMVDNAHRRGKIRFWEEGSQDDTLVSHALGTQSWYNTYGPGSAYGNSIGHIFYSGGNSIIARLGVGGSGLRSDRQNSRFYGNVEIDGSLQVDTVFFGDRRNMQWDNSSHLLYQDNSSRRHKRGIQPLEEDFSKILQLLPRKYYREHEPDRWEIGYIAEEVEALGLKSLVYYDEKGRPDALNYEKMCMYLMEVVREHERLLNKKSPYLERYVEEVPAQEFATPGKKSTKADIMQFLQKLGIEFNPKATKSDLLNKIPKK